MLNQKSEEEEEGGGGGEGGRGEKATNRENLVERKE